MKLRNNKGQLMTSQLFMFIVVTFVIMLIIGITIFGYNAITQSFLSISTPAGQFNISEAAENTIGQINNAMLSQGNIFSTLILLGMLLSMIFAAYITRDRNLLVFFIIDLIILIFAYILSTYIANAYETVLNTVPFKDIFVSNLNTSSTFILNLPIIVLVVGSIIMIVSYAAIPKTKEEEVAGF